VQDYISEVKTQLLHYTFYSYSFGRGLAMRIQDINLNETNSLENDNEISKFQREGIQLMHV